MFAIAGPSPAVILALTVNVPLWLDLPRAIAESRSLYGVLDWPILQALVLAAIALCFALFGAGVGLMLAPIARKLAQSRLGFSTQRTVFASVGAGVLGVFFASLYAVLRIIDVSMELAFVLSLLAPVLLAFIGFSRAYRRLIRE